MLLSNPAIDCHLRPFIFSSNPWRADISHYSQDVVMERDQSTWTCMLHFSQRKLLYHSKLCHRFFGTVFAHCLVCETQQLTIMPIRSIRCYLSFAWRRRFVWIGWPNTIVIFGIELPSYCSQTTQKLGLYFLPNFVYRCIKYGIDDDEFSYRLSML